MGTVNNDDADNGIVDQSKVEKALKDNEPKTDEWMDIVEYNALLYAAVTLAIPVAVIKTPDKSTAGLTLPSLNLGLGIGLGVVVAAIAAVVVIKVLPSRKGR